MYLKRKPTNLNLQTFVKLASKAIDEDTSREVGCSVPAEVISYVKDGWLNYEAVQRELSECLLAWDIVEISHSQADYPAEGEF